MRKYKNEWFIIIITIFIVIIVSIIWFIGINNIIKSNLYINSKNNSFILKEKAINTINTILKYDYALNSDWLWNDILNCSWGLIINNTFWKICTWKWETGSDWIDDSCNNDDETPYFYDKNIDISDKIGNNSIFYDNDANARIFNIWFIFPYEEKTIFYFDKNVKNNLIVNKYNTYFDLINNWEMAKIELELQWWVWTWKINIYNIDDSLNTKYIINSDISLNNKWILNENWNFDIGKPYIFDLSNNKIFAITLLNQSQNIVNYKLTLKNSNNLPIYQIPINYNISTKSLKYYNLQNDNEINSLEIYK